MNEELLDFIEEQGLDIALFIDAEGYPISQIRDEMKANHKIFAYNSTPCQLNNHTTRSISGHCVECDTARIAFTVRHYNLGFVYIAGSIRGQLIKVGYSNNIDNRVKSLNVSNIGGVNDWNIIYHIQVLNAGMIEQQTQSELEPYLTELQYFHNSHLQVSKELFKCSYTKAKDTLIQVVQNLEIPIIRSVEVAPIIEDYNFRNLRRLK
jgi:hypothetical protein